MMCHPPFRALQLFVLLALARASTGAQGVQFESIVRPAGERDELHRVRTLRDSTAPFYSSLRAPSRQFPVEERQRSYSFVSIEVRAGYNSQLPFSVNDGGQWQGRGRNGMISGGVTASYGRVRLTVVPELWTASNNFYQTVPYSQARAERRSVWANPFHPAPEGIDLPSRLGSQAVRHFDVGQSSLTVRLPAVELGLSTENVWWGPGKQNALLWSSQGAGVPSLFVRTSAPRVTRAGVFDAWYTVGSLRQSPFFDRNADNNRRVLSAAALTWRSARTSAVEVGAARMVITTGGLSGRALLAPLRSAGHPNTVDSLTPGNDDQITSLWARWAPPGAGFEGWVEWARFEEPFSLRDLLVQPGHSQGYTVGLQWARPVGAATVRLWGEGTYLEPDPSLRLRPVATTYVSRAVPQGFTVDGQMLGPGIGPGASSQWIGGDWLASRWRAGWYTARIRWDNAALFTDVVPELKREDLSLIAGLRLGGEWADYRILLDWAHEVRLNYLFQAYLKDPATGRTQGIDIVNDALVLTIQTPWKRGPK